MLDLGIKPATITLGGPYHGVRDRAETLRILGLHEPEEPNNQPIDADTIGNESAGSGGVINESANGGAGGVVTQ